MPTTLALWHFARGLALAAKKNPADAEVERASFLAAAKALPADAMYGTLNKSADVMVVAAELLDGKIAAARGDRAAALARLRKAVEAEDALSYDEPPAWWLITRESLGGALLADGRAAEAEKVFRADLERNRRSGRSLFGLSKALEAQGKTYDANLVRGQYEQAWAHADTPLRADAL
jgi:tetratricopeptide (TPR) repeat protein